MDYYPGKGDKHGKVSSASQEVFKCFSQNMNSAVPIDDIINDHYIEGIEEEIFAIVDHVERIFGLLPITVLCCERSISTNIAEETPDFMTELEQRLSDVGYSLEIV